MARARRVLIVLESLALFAIATGGGPLPAQSLHLGPIATYQDFERTSSTVQSLGAWSLGARLRWMPEPSGTVSLSAAAQYLGESGIRPGLTDLSVEVGIRPVRHPRAAPVVILGGGALDFRAHERERIARQCVLAPGCFFEGTFYRSGWTWALHAGLGAELLPLPWLAVEPRATFAWPIGPSTGPGGNDVLLRLGLGLSARL